MQIHAISEHNTKIWVSDHARDFFQADWFEHSPSPESESINEWCSGRQSIVQFNVNGRHMVRRHYCRGGLPARFTKDQFIFRGYTKSRPFLELKLLAEMRAANLPVPEPIAARCKVNGVLYTADIVMSEITDSRTLAQIICEHPLEKDVWVKVGSTIGRFHQQGIQHVDLNANNILIDKRGDVYLIDFDRCVQKPYAESWGQSGLQRLKRSLNKEKNIHANINFQDNDFLLLMQGYQD